jgi:hypothetical protein
LERWPFAWSRDQWIIHLDHSFLPRQFATLAPMKAPTSQLGRFGDAFTIPSRHSVGVIET